MPIVHVENTVRDYEGWKANFDKYERFRVEHGVRAYRVSRATANPNEVIVDLEFADETAASAFLPNLAKIMTSPQAKEYLVDHRRPKVYRVVTERALTADPAG
jgi:hypothetical protein